MQKHSSHPNRYLDLNNPNFYNNRELSWLLFNKRVLEEASDKRNPLFERLKFLAICSSNLDEFFMVRVAGLKDQVKANFNKPENKAGLTPIQQLKEISKLNHQIVSLQDSLYNETILPLLNEEGIQFLTMGVLNCDQLTYLKNHFENYILPVLTPLAIDAYRPFPMLLNKSINLALLITNSQKKSSDKLAIVQVPSVLTRYVEVPSSNGKKQFIMLEDVISYFIETLFTGYNVKSISPFRLTRNADLTIHEESARDLLSVIEKELQKRKSGAAVRLEIQDGIDKKVLTFLLEVLELQMDDVYAFKGPLDYTFLFKFYLSVGKNYSYLTEKNYTPSLPEDLVNEKDIFKAVLKKDLFFHHPYESFEPIIDFISKAADDPNVLAIKQTLYRVSGESPIIMALQNAAENGKQVTVLVELKARFDEENNIQWAKKLEKSGVHVIYGTTGLKTHSKITLIVRHDEDKIQRFVHLGTGNYNDSTAKLYTDMGLITANEEFAEDATNFFNYLSGYREKPRWNYISIAPFEIRTTFINLIEMEIISHKENGDGRIIAKMNSLTDKTIIKKLYEASQSGVKIDLIIRGICCLKPQIEGVSENITVRSIVGRFLEHSRIFYFRHNSYHSVYLSSADWMTRNMEKRIEILFPIIDVNIKTRILNILELTLRDNVKARVQKCDGTYEYVNNDHTPEIESQVMLCRMAQKDS